MGEPNPQAQHRDLPSLTGLRAVASIAVFVNHSDFFLGATSWTVGWSAIRPVGVCGLLLFFVLSGYLLGQPGTLRGGGRSYTARRIARIYPVYLPALALAVASMVRWGLGDQALRPWTLLQNLLLVQSWNPRGEAASISLPAWSLSVELLFYAVLPLTLNPFTRACRVRPALTLALVVAAALLGGEALRLSWVWPTFPPAYLPVFYLGTWAAVRGLAGLWSLAGAVVLASAAVLGYLCWANLALPGLAFLVLVATLARKDRAGRCLLGGVWQRTGAWSMPFFLLHLEVLDLLAIVVPEPARTVPGGLFLGGLVFAGSVLAAAAAHRFVEEPGRRWVMRLASGQRRAARA